MMAAALGPRLGLMTRAMQVAHPDRALLARAAAMARSMPGGVAEWRRWARTHCDVARLLGARMGLAEPVQQALRHERWDGKGMPGDLRREQIPLPVRIMQVAQDADMVWQQGGQVPPNQAMTEPAVRSYSPCGCCGGPASTQTKVKW